MSPAGLSAAAAAVMLALLCCCIGGVSAGEEHFAERLIQSLQGQDGGQSDPEQFSETAASLRRRRFHLGQVPSLMSAFKKAMRHEANGSRWSSARWGSLSRQDQDASAGDDMTSTSTSSGSSGGRVGTWLLVDRRSSGRLHQPHPDGQLYLRGAPPPPPPPQLSAPGAERPFSEREDEFGAHPAQQHSRPLLNITESPQGCSCLGVVSGPERTLSFLISQIPSEERSLLDLHLPVVADARWVTAAATDTLPTRLVLCVTGGAGRSVLASLRLKRGPQRPGWAHAIVSDWLAQLQRRSAADGQRCLQMVLPAGQAAVTLDRGGQRLAHLSSRPLQYGGRRSS